MRVVIKKVFSTMREATDYQNELYETYDYVRLERFPMFCEHGEYVWEVE